MRTSAMGAFLVLGIEAIVLPFERIFVYVFVNCIIIVFITNNVIVKSPLPDVAPYNT